MTQRMGIEKGIFAGLLLAGWAAAAPEDSTAAPKLGFKSGGYVYWENFRLWEADYQGRIQEGDWFNSILGGFVLENAMSERLATRVALEARIYRPFPEEQGQEVSRLTKPDVYVHEAKALYKFGNPAQPPFEMEVGYFLYDYNRDQHNLGEYLFRSKIYPINLFTDFELPMDRLLGIRIGNRPFPGFHHDLLLTSEYKYYPKSDFSISYLADYTWSGLQLGYGVSWVHGIPVRPALVTPTSDENTFVRIPAQTFTDTAGNPRVLAAPVEGFKTALLADTNLTFQRSGSFSREFLPGLQREVTHFTYQGIKLMGRVGLDPKPLLGLTSLFGPEDLKLYAEAAVLGVSDYPFLYADIQDRIPVMFGFNFPGFKIIDVIGLEAEFCGYKFPNNWQKSLRSGIPQPGDANFTYGNYNPDDFAQDDWKWSLYLRKQVSRGLFISAQMASDHLRLSDKAGFTYESLMKDTDRPFSGQWWGILRVTASY